ncbi:RNA polymerase sigma-70 factor [Sphingobacterium gobiense]|uniref:RNA polymerase sigma-70 factor n=1 Tax=Sphingobacterium gobiense TaxID=1382456 RepID=A0A2S9JV85_9SPHI|nr:RNA polymerase sigma-70 factor [Sphingobacterium gobiense]PRD57163.1 RNA polymerase sigma-70 factor [Sphingobacterium gobiense]
MIIYRDLTDNELYLHLHQDDESAFTEIYNRFWKKLFTIAANRIGNLEEAEEIVQDIFTSLWNKRSDMVLRSDLASYLAVSVKYRVIKSMDRQYNEKRYVDSLLGTGLVDDSTQQKLAFEELQNELEKHIQMLPEKCQLVFRLSRQDGYSQKKIADELGISEKTVEAHLGKAFKRLRARLAGFLTTLL